MASAITDETFQAQLALDYLQSQLLANYNSAENRRKAYESTAFTEEQRMS